MGNDTAWVIPSIFGMLILIVAITVAGIGISEFLKARRNRIYKSIEEHRDVQAKVGRTVR